jgi:DNA-binding NtrC family response regulator
MVSRALFREALLYRINTIHVEIPPLREHPEDLLPLAERFLKRYAAVYGKPDLQLGLKTGEKLKAQSWPGNIRELQHTLEATLFHFATRRKTPPLKEVATLEEMNIR